MAENNEDNIFLEEKHHDTQVCQDQKEEPLPESIVYLKRGDSSIYINQFLEKEEPGSAKIDELPRRPAEEIKEEGSHESQHDSHESGESKNKITPSAFHNFQKHLTVALKNSIQIAPQDKCYRQHQKVAYQLWKVFRNSAVSTKKILHYLLGERNEHQITDEGLKIYGFAKICESHSMQVLREARKLLAAETLRQIRGQKFLAYVEHRRIKDKQKFRRYVSIFIEELQQGFLKKRLTKQKVSELLTND